jgi:hypothetical protein
MLADAHQALHRANAWHNCKTGRATGWWEEGEQDCMRHHGRTAGSRAARRDGLACNARLVNPLSKHFTDMQITMPVALTDGHDSLALADMEDDVHDDRFPFGSTRFDP